MVSLQTSQKPRCRCLQRGFLFVLSYICHTAVRHIFKVLDLVAH